MRKLGYYAALFIVTGALFSGIPMNVHAEEQSLEHESGNDLSAQNSTSTDGGNEDSVQPNESDIPQTVLVLIKESTVCADGSADSLSSPEIPVTIKEDTTDNTTIPAAEYPQVSGADAPIPPAMDADPGALSSDFDAQSAEEVDAIVPITPSSPTVIRSEEPTTQNTAGIDDVETESPEVAGVEESTIPVTAVSADHEASDNGFSKTSGVEAPSTVDFSGSDDIYDTLNSEESESVIAESQEAYNTHETATAVETNTAIAEVQMESSLKTAEELIVAAKSGEAKKTIASPSLEIESVEGNATSQPQIPVNTGSSYLTKDEKDKYDTYQVINLTNSGISNAPLNVKEIQKALCIAMDFSTLFSPDNKLLVKVIGGTYYIDNSLKLYSNTDLVLDDGVVIMRSPNALNKTMLVGGEASGSLCAGVHDVTISGGIWDGNVNADRSDKIAAALMQFSHAKNLTLSNTVFRNTNSPYMIKVEGGQNVSINNVQFINQIPYSGSSTDSMKTDSLNNETVHISEATDDNTPSTEVTIQNSSFNNVPTAIGLTTGSASVLNDNVSINKNSFTDVRQACVRMENSTNAAVNSNTVFKAKYFLHTNNADVTAQNNTVKETDTFLYQPESKAKPITAILKNNAVTGAKAGIIVWGTGSIISLTGEKYTLNDESGYILDTKGTDVTVTGSSLKGGRGVISSSKGKLTVSKTDFRDTSYFAIAAYNADGSAITDNTFVNCGTATKRFALLLSNTKNAKIIGNDFMDGYCGIYLTNSSENRVENNAIRWSKIAKSITLVNDSNNNTIRDNTLSLTSVINVDSTSTENAIIGNSRFEGMIVKSGDAYIFRNDDGSLARNSWKIVNGKRYYFDENGKTKKGWSEIGGTKYYFNIDGTAKLYSQTIGNKQYYFNGQGAMKKGWVKFSSTGQWKYYGVDGAMQTGFLTIGANRYYLDPRTGCRVRYSKEINGKKYYFNADGVMKTGWQYFNGDKQWKYFNGDGVMQTGFVTVGDNMYYLDPVTGGRVRYLKEICGKKYYFNSNGVMKKGWQYFGGEKLWKYFGSNGAMQTGFVTVNRDTYYLNPMTGGRVRYTQTIEGKDYYFNSEGVMAKGPVWFSGDHGFRYFDTDGARIKKEGWITDGNAKYRMGADSLLILGDLSIDGKQYYFNSKNQGRMQTGWLEHKSNKWRYYSADGSMKIGWLELDGSKYYLGADGYMYTGVKTIDGKEYYFAVNGIMYSPVQGKDSFLDSIRSLVIKDMNSSGILASLTAAQAFLESARGTSKLTRIANNLFGIKGSYNGNFVVMPTTEYYNGGSHTVNATFRAYASYSESIADHSSLFNSMDRYANLRNLSDYRLAAQNVKADGYATDPFYSVSLINIIKKYDLFTWDGSSAYHVDGERDVEVTASSLNVRSGPGTSTTIRGSLGNGSIVTISEVSGNWGRLADYNDGSGGSAWICLDYVNNK